MFYIDFFLSSITNKNFTGLDNMSYYGVIRYWNCIPFGNTWFTTILMGSVLIIFLEFSVLHFSLRLVPLDFSNVYL